MRSPSSTPSRRSCTATSIDMSIAWLQSRYDKAGPGGSGADYINCPMTREQYDAFVDALLAGDKIAFHELGSRHALFRRLPADRGDGRARPRDAAPWPDEAGRPDQSARARPKAYAVVQLRQDNRLGTLFNMVGFQTKLKHGEQIRIFRTIPGLGTRRIRPARRPAPQHLPQFARSCSTPRLRLRAQPRLRFAGQITGCEGYVESAAIGLLAGRFAAAERLGECAGTAAADHGAWRPARRTSPAAISRPSMPDRAPIQPMNVNFGLFPPLAQAPTRRSRRRAAAGRREDRSPRSRSSAPVR